MDGTWKQRLGNRDEVPGWLKVERWFRETRDRQMKVTLPMVRFLEQDDAEMTNSRREGQPGVGERQP